MRWRKLLSNTTVAIFEDLKFVVELPNVIPEPAAQVGCHLRLQAPDASFCLSFSTTSGRARIGV